MGWIWRNCPSHRHCPILLLKTNRTSLPRLVVLRLGEKASASDMTLRLERLIASERTLKAAAEANANRLSQVSLCVRLWKGGGGYWVVDCACRETAISCQRLEWPFLFGWCFERALKRLALRSPILQMLRAIHPFILSRTPCLLFPLPR